MKCEKCGGDCERTEVDVGVGVISGPWGCWSCGWSSDREYDCSEEWARGESKRDGNGIIDPLGGWWRSCVGDGCADSLCLTHGEGAAS